MQISHSTTVIPYFSGKPQGNAQHADVYGKPCWWPFWQEPEEEGGPGSGSRAPRIWHQTGKFPFPILAPYMGAPEDVKTILVCHECSAYICKVHAAPTRRRRSGPCSSGQSQLCCQSAKDCTKNTPADIIVDTVTDTKLITSELTEIIKFSATDLLKLI